MATKKINSRPTFDTVKAILNTLLKGIAQIMLQENAMTGLLFLSGIFYGSVWMGFAALLSVSVGTFTASILNYDKKEISQGLYGFSPTLVGVATIVFLKPIAISWLFVIIGSAAAAILQHIFIKNKIPAFTFPFIIVTWGIFYVSKFFYPTLLIENTTVIITEIDKYFFAFKGYGQIIFQASIVSGILFFIGVFISKPTAALYGLAGAVGSSFLAFYFFPADVIYNGLISYNAILCAIVLSEDKKQNFVWSICSVLLSILLLFLMTKYSILPLTFPFVLATWIILFTKHKLIDSKK